MQLTPSVAREPLRTRRITIHGYRRKLDKCHALVTDGPVVARYYPRWYHGAKKQAG